ncbi:MAG: 5' nucleotidase, NT5C type [Syntrophobacteraceae bacterium]
MSKSPIRPIDLDTIAFDIDGVVADTMSVFVRLAHEKYGLTKLSKQDMLCYNLYNCLGLEKGIIDDLIDLTLDEEHTRLLPPIAGAPEVLTELAGSTPLRFITARTGADSISEWIFSILPTVCRRDITVIASGSPDCKLGILRQLGIRYFVEDRLETCKNLKEAGIEPLVFEQPWNRDEVAPGFIRIHDWAQLRQWLLPNGANLE